MFLWGLVALTLLQAVEEPKVIKTKIVMEPDCHIPAAPPCIPFSDPRWRDPDCRVDNGACFVLQAEQAKRPEPLVRIIISPKCEDESSRGQLIKAARRMLSEMRHSGLVSEEETVECSSKGYVDVRLTVQDSD
jgi:hypothetical protein